VRIPYFDDRLLVEQVDPAADQRDHTCTDCGQLLIPASHHPTSPNSGCNHPSKKRSDGVE
jgi:hypothetical protein